MSSFHSTASGKTVGMRAGADATGSVDGVSIVTLLAALTVLPSCVVLAVNAHSRAILAAI